MPFANSSLSPLETTAYSSSCKKNQNRNLILKLCFCFYQDPIVKRNILCFVFNIFLNVTSSKHYYFGRYEIARVVLSALRKILLSHTRYKRLSSNAILSPWRLLLDENLNDVFPRRRGAPPDVAQVRHLIKVVRRRRRSRFVTVIVSSRWRSWS